jgi:hypothetical protein
LKAMTDDVCDDAFKVSSLVFGANAKRLDALLASPSIAPFIVKRIVAELMREPVDLDGDARRSAEKVEHERSKGVLSSEMQSFGALTKHSPEPNL